MAQLRLKHQGFIERQAEIIVVGPEDKTLFAEWWQKEAMPFPGIPDPRHIIAGSYGQQVKPLKMGRMPALILIDKNGLMRFRHYGDSMSDIPPVEDVFRLLDDLNMEAKS
jgi:peroxiredoxin Q/BCP